MCLVILTKESLTKTRFEIAGVSDVTNDLVNNQIKRISESVEAGLICIFIELCILNEARVSSYIQDILRHEGFF